jgi:hypothetical protein
MADTATTSDPVTAEAHRIGRNIRKHSQLLSQDLAQLRDLFAKYGIDIQFSTPDEGVRSAKDQIT